MRYNIHTRRLDRNAVPSEHEPHRGTCPQPQVEVKGNKMSRRLSKSRPGQAYLLVSLFFQLRCFMKIPPNYVNDFPDSLPLPGSPAIHCCRGWSCYYCSPYVAHLPVSSIATIQLLDQGNRQKTDSFALFWLLKAVRRCPSRLSLYQDVSAQTASRGQ